MRRLPDLEAWALFAKVAETRSFTRADSELGISKPTVSKAISRLEARIGTALLNRTSRRLSLTEAGRRAARSAGRILTEGEALETEAMDQATAPSGLVRLTAPMSFGIAHVAPLLPELFETYPELSVDLHLADEVVDLVGGGFDIAIRIAALPDSALRTRRVCRVRRLLVGAPEYFERRGRPEHPGDLAKHVCLGYAYLPSSSRWHFRHATGEEVDVVPGGPLRVNNADALRPMLVAGRGLAVQPEFMAAEDIAAGRLEVAMADWSMPPIALNIVTPPSGLRPARVTAVIDFLWHHFANAPWSSGRMLDNSADDPC